MSKATLERRRFLQLTLLGSIAIAIAGCAPGGGHVSASRLRSRRSEHVYNDHERKGRGGGAGGGGL